MNIYQNNFKRLTGIFGDLSELPEYLELKSGGFMDLNLDVLSKDNWGTDKASTTIAIAHYHEQNGDLMADPDMTIRIYHVLRMAEALTYQQDNLGICHEVYPKPGWVNPRYKRELNDFLLQWLKNLREQGFKGEGGADVNNNNPPLPNLRQDETEGETFLWSVPSPGEMQTPGV